MWTTALNCGLHQKEQIYLGWRRFRKKLFFSQNLQHQKSLILGSTRSYEDAFHSTALGKIQNNLCLEDRGSPGSWLRHQGDSWWRFKIGKKSSGWVHWEGKELHNGPVFPMARSQIVQFNPPTDQESLGLWDRRLQMSTRCSHGHYLWRTRDARTRSQRYKWTRSFFQLHCLSKEEWRTCQCLGIDPKNKGSWDIIPANFLDYPPNFWLRTRF